VSVRARKHTAAAIVAVLAFILTRVSDAAGWSTAGMYAVGAGLLAVVGVVAMFWIEWAPDGAFHRRPPA
jgi:hypothetical protein